MKSSNSKRIFVLIWVVLSLSALASIYTLIKGMVQYSNNHLLLWLTINKLVITGILLFMSLSLWRIVKAYTRKNDWRPQYYQKVKQIGYWAIALILLNASFQFAYETLWLTMSHLNIHHSLIYEIQRFYAIVLMESPAMWVLTLNIFLFAELLNVANQVKAENESII